MILPYLGMWEGENDSGQCATGWFDQIKNGENLSLPLYVLFAEPVECNNIF